MPEPDVYDYTRYLAAKQPIDERSINRRVWRCFVDEMNQKQEPIRILEVGCGLGATAERVLEALGTADVEYMLVDRSETHVQHTQQRLRDWARQAGYACRSEAGFLSFRDAERHGRIRTVAADYFAFVEQADATWDVLVAQAFWDLIHIEEALARVRPVLASDALLYFPIHFDGLTAFAPLNDQELDERIVRAYHRSMDARMTAHGPSGGSRTGRALMLALRTLGASLLAAGSSDWVVAADGEGFTNEEKYFLHHILHFVEASVGKHTRLDTAAIERWLKKRRRQVEDDSLIFIAHQLDVLGQLREG